MTELSGKRSKKTLSKRMIFVATTLMAILLIAVGITVYNDSTKLKSIVFSSDSMLMKVGGKDSMTFTSDPVDYNLFKLEWASSDVKVASVTESGIVTGLTVGKTTITAQGKNKVADSFIVEVVNDNCPLNPAADRVACLDKNRVINLMPDFEGFEKAEKVIDGYTKYVYISKADNRYGVPIGEIGGYYKEEVTFEGKTVGGIAFIPKIVEKLLADKDGKVLVIPVDISEINNENLVSMSLKGVVAKNGELYRNVIVEIDTNGNLVSLSNGTTTGFITSGIKCGEGCIGGGYPDYFKNGFGPYVPEKSEDLYIPRILGSFIFKEEFFGIYPLGKKITETNGLFCVMLNISVNTRPMTKDDLLKIDNSIVFLKDLD